jgi:hypothetical protein
MPQVEFQLRDEFFANFCDNKVPAYLLTSGELGTLCHVRIIPRLPGPSDLVLDIELASESSFPGTWDITVTLNITNNTGSSVLVDTNDVTSGSGAITWQPPEDITLADGESGVLIGTTNVGAGVHEFSGTVSESSTGVTSNEDTESITT